MRVRVLICLLLCVALGGTGCSAYKLVHYVLFPDVPKFEAGEVREIPGLREPVEVALREDGLWRIEARNEHDAILALGYLQARDRMAQLDIFRHMARGELAALLGNRVMAGSSTLELDIRNRFLGFRDRGERLYRATSAEEREALEAFAQGVNGWIAERHLSLEHRLLGVERVRAWTPLDSLAIYGFIMHGLGSNADREIRRLRIACEAGLEALERIWPQDIEFEALALPAEDQPKGSHPPQPAVVPELAAELSELCAAAASDRHVVLQAKHRPSTRPDLLDGEQLAALSELLAQGWSASNCWVVSGTHTRSGKPILSSDPHLPHMAPPILWGIEIVTPGWHIAGFTLPGLHRVVFGHNGNVAYGATTNHVDRQDLVIHRPRDESRGGERTQGYEVDGGFVPFELRRESFEVRGGEPVEAVVRFTSDGPLLNDLELGLAGKIPLTALRRAPLGQARDLDGARAINHANSAAEFAAGIALLDLGCSNWLFADTQGHIGYRSPCILPMRRGWRGTFPVAGWLSRYAWQGVYAKSELPASDDPRRGWLASANNQVIPSRRFPSAYNNDASSPNRFLRITQRLAEERRKGGLTRDASAAIQLDTRYEHWQALREELAGDFCADERSQGETSKLWEARRLLCRWDGDMAADSSAATLYTLLTHALLDHALADELPGDSGREVWEYAQSLLQFEANVAWLWSRPERAPVWDDARTSETETRNDILRAALAQAVALGSRRWGDDLDGWAWGEVRPFVLKHLFASRGGLPGRILNAPPMPIPGGTETPFKQQFPRADREHMDPVVGPLVRFSVDMADPWAATYSLAGGESGWPRSPRYANLLQDWRTGRGRPLTPPASKDSVRVELVPRR